jgi:ferrous iron transport protein A
MAVITATHSEEGHLMSESPMPLSMMRSGATAIVQEIRGGRKMRQRLVDMGLHQGAVITILRNDISGPLIIAVKEDGRLALGRGMAHHILVTDKLDQQNSYREGTHDNHRCARRQSKRRKKHHL